MIRSLISAVLILSFIFTMSACITEEIPATTAEETTVAEETTTELTTEAETTEAEEETVNINFDEATAEEIFTFNTEIYGKLTVFLQRGYFLIFDEFGSKRFTIYAEGYSTSKTDYVPIGISDDMNFDGYTDFGICYYNNELNSFYFCFLWDNEARTYRYYLPLSTIANPEFNKTNETVISNNRQTYTDTHREKYYFLGEELRLLSSEFVTEEPSEATVIGAESVDAKPDILENGNSVMITLNASPHSDSKWHCIIDDEEIVSLSSENYSETENKYEFLLTSLKEGETFVTFRYISKETGTYAEELVFDVRVDENKNVTAEEL